MKISSARRGPGAEGNSGEEQRQAQAEYEIFHPCVEPFSFLSTASTLGLPQPHLILLWGSVPRCWCTLDRFIDHFGPETSREVGPVLSPGSAHIGAMFQYFSKQSLCHSQQKSHQQVILYTSKCPQVVATRQLRWSHIDPKQLPRGWIVVQC